ncbi:DNA-binding response regulator [Leptolyngbyaceae cyanobacterium CCMR0082]|uniref:DNA-binding response regulator n=2 Tax=Adonisia turfae TaxID=2950184 RepID=A0A6M0SHP9_9CYAN|nr:response regulator transcription factor [Adonisia turfae]EKU97218.1 response regulator with CheY-like receiver domain and winged-helix DNA-binding domain [Leptolyngbya sp. PCC 7375]MDV3353104.1 response regulator transcription factor [Leptothoe sp. LEGE 181152]NEZ54684.1 DNA-binding response regulator [Adonisia turfae CCMR0081]NEZ68100.1 DNA-binding response regulator [Adonisia turfae CCMR0082]
MGASDAAPCVLLVEANEELAQDVSNDLRESGYIPLVATTIDSGIKEVQTRHPALIVVNRMLAGESGLDLCQQLRSQGDRTPMLLLMARDNLDDRVACIESGADDYFLKPYRSDEFLALVSAYLQPSEYGVEQLVFGELTLNITNRQAMRSSRVIDLTMKEFELLKYLMEHPREVLTREQILENVWGYNFMGESNVIEVYIRYLRLKIDGEGEKRLIQTVRGVGYVLRET